VDGALFYFVLLQKSIRNQVTYKGEKFISHSFGDWEIQDQSAHILQESSLLCPLMAESERVTEV
jgi:hypothetical protein